MHQCATRTLLARINEKLETEGEAVRRSDDVTSLIALGEFCRVRLVDDVVIARDIDLEVLGRELGLVDADELGGVSDDRARR